MEQPCSSSQLENGLEVGLPLIRSEYCKRLQGNDIFLMPRFSEEPALVAVHGCFYQEYTFQPRPDQLHPPSPVAISMRYAPYSLFESGSARANSWSELM